MCLKAGLYDEIFLSQVVKSFFRQFPFNIWYVYTAAKCEWNFSIYNQESISEEKILTRFLIKIFSSEIHFTNQRSNLYWKWRNDKYEVNTKQDMNENLKTYVWNESRKNQNNKADFNKKTRKFCKWIIIGGNCFIISRIINWVTSQFLNINIKSWSRTSALPKVVFIVTVAAIMIFLVKLVFLLSLINIAHSLKRSRSWKKNLIV